MRLICTRTGNEPVQSPAWDEYCFTVYSGADAAAEGSVLIQMSEARRGVRTSRFADSSIRTKIAVIAGVPCGVAVLAMALVLPNAVENHRRATALRSSNNATDKLIVAASEQAKERGFTASLLSSTASKNLAPSVLSLRASGDARLDEALYDTARVAEANAMLQRARRELIELRHLRDALRSEVDAELGRYPAPPRLVGRWFDAQTALIESEDRYMRALFVAQNPYELIVQYNTYIKRYVFLASEFAGRERATLSGVIASRQPISAATQALLDKWRGVVEENLEAIRQLKANPDMPQAMVNTIAGMEQRFLGTFESVRSSVYAASREAAERADGAPVPYPMTPPQWIAESTQAIDTVIGVSASIGRSAEAISAKQTRQSLANLGLLALMFGALIASVIFSWQISRRLVLPLLQLRDAARGYVAAGAPPSSTHAALQAAAHASSLDEVGQVARSLAEMSRRVSESMALLADEKQAVESRVRERTAQLREQQAHAEKLAVVLATQNEKFATANEYLIELNAERREFLDLCTHELKAPLVSQIALMDLLGDAHEPQQRAQLSRRLVASNTRMLTLVQNLLRVSALEVGAQRLANEAVDLAAAVREALALNADRARAKRIALHFGASIFDGGTGRIVGDRPAVVQIVDNLLSNAIKFSQPGSTVSVHLAPQGDAVELHVADQGPGIAEAEQARLFRKFSKLSSRPTDGEASTGLGLAIVRQLATGMGARVGYSSRPGKGSDFSVAFRSVAVTVVAAKPRGIEGDDSVFAAA